VGVHLAADRTRLYHGHQCRPFCDLRVQGVARTCRDGGPGVNGLLSQAEHVNRPTGECRAGTYGPPLDRWGTLIQLSLPAVRTCREPPTVASRLPRDCRVDLDSGFRSRLVAAVEHGVWLRPLLVAGPDLNRPELGQVEQRVPARRPNRSVGATLVQPWPFKRRSRSSATSRSSSAVAWA
jgi:hypothetical protein